MAAAAVSRPNFIFILADDLGWTSLAPRMNDRVPNSRSDYHETPALERLTPGSQCDVPVAGRDLLPTLADLAG